MADLLHHRVWCEVDLQYEKVWSETAPTVCPVNPAHAITVSKSSALKPRAGRHRIRYKSLSRSTTTSTTFQIKVSFTTDTLGGRYKISWNCLVDNNNTVGEVRLRNTTDSINVGGLLVFKQASSAVRGYASGCGEIDFFGSTKTFELQWRARVSGKQQGISIANVFIVGV